MKPVIAALLALALVFSNTALAAQEKINVYTWDTYIATDLFRKFEQETGIEVITDIYSDNDTMMARLKTGAAYDIVMPTGNFIPMLVAENLLRPLPEALKERAGGMLENVKKPLYDKDYMHSLPVFFGTTAIVANTRLTTEKITSWKQFFERPAAEKPSIGVLDDVTTVMHITSLAAGKKHCDNSPETFKALQSLLQNQKPFVKVYGATGYFERMAANEVALQMAWSGDAYTARMENPALTYIYPEEGVEIWIDNLAIPAAAPNPEGAAKFIDFILRPENSAAYAEVSGNVPVIQAAQALLPESLRTAPEFNIPPGLRTSMADSCPPEVIAAHAKIWERLLQ